MTTIGPFQLDQAYRAADNLFAHKLEIGAVEPHEYKVCRRWCRDRFGKAGILQDPPGSMRYVVRTNKRWGQIGWTFYFQEIDHAFEFKMRWC